MSRMRFGRVASTICFFAREQRPVGVERDQPRVRAVGDVLDQSLRQSDERGVVVDRRG